MKSILLIFIGLLVNIEAIAANSLVNIHMRSFAPFKDFGGGFEGDDRDFSTSDSVSSRIHTKVAFDYKSNKVISIDSNSSGTTHLPTGTSATAKPVATINSDCEVDICISHEGGNPVTDDLAGGLGSYFTPDIDLHSMINFEDSFNYLEVSVVAVGDAFPNAEIFLEDAKGVRLMLLEFKTTGGPNDGPITYLPGDSKRPMGSVICKVGLDSSGNFDRSVSCSN